MTKYLHTLQIGDKVEIFGPAGRIHYLGQGHWNITENPALGNVTRTKLGFIAGGTGIAPCFNVINTISKHDDAVEVSLIVANHTPQDILLLE
jgi:NAD(P)H-flavin reductase